MISRIFQTRVYVQISVVVDAATNEELNWLLVLMN
jgi:hypothetical protein